MSIEEKQTAPLFIFGYMHSGTSLLFNVLSSAKEVNSYKKEINFIQRRSIINKEYKTVKTPAEKAEFFKATIECNGNASGLSENIYSEPQNVVSDYFSFWAAISIGYSYYLDGSPNNYLFDDLISEYKPNYKAIAIVRDPRNVIASKKKRWQTTTIQRYEKDKLLRKKMEKGYSTSWDSISLSRGIEKVGRISKKKCLVVKYEELVGNYDQVVRSISGFLGLDEHSMVKSTEISFSNKADRSVKESGLYIGSTYEKNLSPSEIHIVQLFCRKQMVKYGYPFERIGFWHKVGSLKYILLMVYELVARLAKRLVLSGPKGFLNYISLSYNRMR